jgi:mono/diheme cytochrome c family protein
MVSADWVREFLNDPQAAKPGTTMPDVLAGLAAPDRKGAAEALAQFLCSSGKVAPKRSKGAKSEKFPTFCSAGRGRALFHEIGCVACHAPRLNSEAAPSTQPAAVFAVPLPDLKRKYSLASLFEFVRQPLAHRPAGRMPDLQLETQEAIDIAAYLLDWDDTETFEAKPIHPPPPDAALSAKGQGLFESLGCANCHQREGTKSTLTAKPLSEIAQSDGGCIAGVAGKGVPHYVLSDAQRQAIHEAASQTAAPEVATQVALAMERLNCLACHQRDGRGGPDAARERYFIGEPEMSDEGRFPPKLTGVGRKLTREWLEKVLGREGRVRPYLHTRMPVFGAAVASLPQEFIKVDGGHDSTAKDAFAEGDVEAGRQLLGTGGMSCITCHGLRGHASIGIHAVDLGNTSGRLQGEWFKANLLDPAGMRPGTLMPAFWPEGKSANASILGGDTAKQIASIWVYLRDGKTEPDGYPPPRGEFELIAQDKPVLLRCFMKVAGTQAIAVGFAQKVHFAFDAEKIRPALAWKGRFLDAYSTWYVRAQPFVDPLGESVVELPSSMPFATLDRSDAPWPAASGTDAGYRLGGYRLDKHGIPTFLYRFGPTEIEDRIVPSEDGKGLVRTLTLRGEHQNLYFRAGQAKGINIRVIGTAGEILPIRFEHGENHLTVQYQW